MEQLERQYEKLLFVFAVCIYAFIACDCKRKRNDTIPSANAFAQLMAYVNHRLSFNAIKFGDYAAVAHNDDDDDKVIWRITLLPHYRLLSSCVLSLFSIHSAQWELNLKNQIGLLKDCDKIDACSLHKHNSHNTLLSLNFNTHKVFAFVGAWIEALVRNVVYVLRVLSKRINSIEIPLHSWKFLLIKGDSLKLTHSFLPCEEASVIECETALMFKLHNFLLQ